MTVLSPLRLAAACAVALASTAATAEGSATGTDFVFNTAPFAGVDVSAPTRQVVANERFISHFSTGTDRFVFDSAAFGVDHLSFFNGVAADLPASGFNVIVLADNDNDNNPATSFNAGSAANLIAARIEQAGPGFFLYTNQALGLNRLVFSSDLSVATGDLKIVARLEKPTGFDAIAVKSDFGAQNFALAPVPEPQTYALMLSGLLAVAGAARRQRAQGRPHA